MGNNNFRSMYPSSLETKQCIDSIKELNDVNKASRLILKISDQLLTCSMNMEQGYFTKVQKHHTMSGYVSNLRCSMDNVSSKNAIVPSQDVFLRLFHVLTQYMKDATNLTKINILGEVHGIDNTLRQMQPSFTIENKYQVDNDSQKLQLTEPEELKLEILFSHKSENGLLNENEYLNFPEQIEVCNIKVHKLFPINYFDDRSYDVSIHLEASFIIKECITLIKINGKPLDVNPTVEDTLIGASIFIGAAVGTTISIVGSVAIIPILVSLGVGMAMIGLIALIRECCLSRRELQKANQLLEELRNTQKNMNENLDSYLAR